VRFRRALGWMLWALLLASGIASMEQLSEFERMRELSLHGNKVSELEHNSTYRGLYRWNCSHEAFFPYACKDGELLCLPRAKSRSALLLLQFAWTDHTKAQR
jgi:hypothetical protein